MKTFKEILPEELNENIFELIGKKQMLITSKDSSKGSGVNAMTASWGTVGILWGKPVCTVFIRPQRYSLPLVEKSEYISLCFPDAKNRNTLGYCGSHSGKDEDKIKNLSLNILEYENTPYIEESDIIFICKILYSDSLKKENFKDVSPLSTYSAGDFHKFFVCEIKKVLLAE